MPGGRRRRVCGFDRTVKSLREITGDYARPETPPTVRVEKAQSASSISLQDHVELCRAIHFAVFAGWLLPGDVDAEVQDRPRQRGIGRVGLRHSNEFRAR